MGTARTRTVAEPGLGNGLGTVVRVRGVLVEVRIRAWWVVIVTEFALIV